MYFRCEVEQESIVYVQAWLKSKTRNELFQLLEQSPVWQARIERLKSAPVRDSYYHAWNLCRELPDGSLEYSKTRKAEINGWRRQTSLEARGPRPFTIKKTARSFHYYLRSKGVKLGEWSSKCYHCTNGRTFDVEALNNIIREAA